MSAMSPQQYRPSRRSWIKLWVSEWLDGTVRWQLTQQQRSVWADLMALAGYSRFPGVVTPGTDGQGFVAYPMEHLASVFRCTIEEARETLDLLEKQQRITRDENGVIRIVNWDKYQSEYQQKRQRTRYGNKATESTRNVRTKSEKSQQQEVEVEVETEVEVEKKTPSPTKGVGGELGSAEFREFWSAYPKKVDRLETVKVWVKGLLDGKLGEILAGLECWKRTEQWQDVDKIPYPSTWLNKRRWKDAPQAGSKVSPAQQKARNTDAAIERVKQKFNLGVAGPSK